jgi:hypothetical protein
MRSRFEAQLGALFRVPSGALVEIDTADGNVGLGVFGVEVRGHLIAETHEYVGGELRHGDRPDGKQIARHLRSVIAALPKGIQKIFARADSGFYGWEAVQAYHKAKVHFIIVARKTSRLLGQLQTADWKPSPKTDADEQCEFRYSPEGRARPTAFRPQ